MVLFMFGVAFALGVVAVIAVCKSETDRAPYSFYGIRASLYILIAILTVQKYMPESFITNIMGVKDLNVDVYVIMVSIFEAVSNLGTCIKTK